MKALVCNVNDKLVLEERKNPIAGPQSATVEVLLTGICGTDLRTYRYGSRHITPPRIIGHELVGRIVELGDGLDGFAEGDRVHVAPAIGCGECYYCANGDSNLCETLRTIGFQYDGSFSERMEIPALAFKQGNITRLDPGAVDEEIVLAEPLACVINAQQFLPIGETGSVAIFGGGFIGCLHAELALSRGATSVFIVEIDEKRADAAAQAVPRAAILNPRRKDATAEIRNQTEGRGVDVSVVACSVGSAQRDAIGITRKLGHVSLFGGLPGESTGFVDSNVIHYNEISIHGVHASSPTHNKKAIELLQSGEINARPYNGDIFPLSNILRAFEAVDRQEVLKALIRPGS